MKKLLHAFFLFGFFTSAQPFWLETEFEKPQSQSIVAPEDEFPPLVAVFGAEGFGKNTTGGRGGTIIEVTNLNESGPGSYAEALTTQGPRTIVFGVSGVIRHSGIANGTVGSIEINNRNGNRDNLTIAGATAPGPIEIQGIQTNIRVSNVIMSHIRIRGKFDNYIDPSPDGHGSHKCLRVRTDDSNYEHLSNFYFFNNSWYYATDENFSTTAAEPYSISKMTVIDNIIAQGKYGALIFHNNYDISIVRNFWSNNSGRTMAYSSAGDNRKEVINNITNDSDWALISVTAGERIDAIGNIGKENPNSPEGHTTNYLYSLTVNKGNNTKGYSVADSFVYGFDNIFADNFQPQAGNNGVHSNWAARAKTNRVLTGNITSPISTSILESKVFGTSGAGATPWARDSIDTAEINYYLNENGILKDGQPSLTDPSDFLNPSKLGHPPLYWSKIKGISNTFVNEHNIVGPWEIKPTWTINGKTWGNTQKWTAFDVWHAYITKWFD